MLVDGLRPLWLTSIAGVTGSPTGRISEWVGAGQYYFDAAVGPNTATFVLTPGSTLTNTFAAEMSRFSLSAIETSLAISRAELPKSTAWLFIQTYYAAFYAAHSILRSVGISASNFRTAQCQKADQVATALGFGTAPLTAAQFRCEYFASTGRMECNKAAGAAVHEQFWRVFAFFLDHAIQKILNNPTLPSQEAQEIFTKLDALRSVLKSNGQSGGNWLSTLRNEVTYMHQHDAWFPYGRSRSECDRLFVLQKTWLREPEGLEIEPLGGTTAERFVRACAFLVSLSVAVVKDMEIRCPSGKSFLSDGPIKLLSQAAAH